MKISVKATSVEEILPWRDLYRQEMNCQIIHDSLHSRKGWTQSYVLHAGGAAAGYGAVVLGGPWKGKSSVFEFFVLPQHQSAAFELFSALLKTSGAKMIDVQTNDTLLTVMLHTFASSVTSEKIIFEEKVTTMHPSNDLFFRRITPEDAKGIFPHEVEPVGDWVIEADGKIVATGGILFHYNRPYGDIYMEVAEPFRKRGIGAYLVQELKRVCYEQGSVPAARCAPTNVASRKTLLKAGFAPCGHILIGTISKTPTNQA